MAALAPAASAGGAAIRPASTVMLIRDAAPDADPALGGIEVLMTRRPPTAAFNPDAWVFPGGAVEEADAYAPVMAGPADPYLVAGARECYEEAGILLARHPDGSWPAQADLTALGDQRENLSAGLLTFTEFLSTAGLALDLSGVHHVSRWVTPPGLSRRFDTRFLVAASPPGQEAAAYVTEVVEARWITPEEAIRRRQRGEYRIVLPTWKHLEGLAAHGTVAEVLEAASRIGPVPVIDPAANGFDITMAFGQRHPAGGADA